ncbi:hypothetical protein [Streptomyces sp. CA2R106]|uniref:hypothetical protein n=1 Tax=Streptomyces sp. CA2R106 TaxID=3120153 RepID=UPI0030087BCE
MQHNNGIQASGGANVAGNAVASGLDARAEVTLTDSEVHQTAPRPPGTPEEISALLGRLVDELARSGRPDRDDLIDLAEAARDTLAAPAPRLSTLRALSRALADALPGATALATLATTIADAIRRL